MPTSRRIWLRLAAGAAMAAPLAALTTQARAARNDASRKALQYQDKPKDGAQCASCAQFIAGKTPKDPGGCKVIPGDMEISPTGWCVAYSKKA
jgi:hypothetical protein